MNLHSASTPFFSFDTCVSASLAVSGPPKLTSKTWTTSVSRGGGLDCPEAAATTGPWRPPSRLCGEAAVWCVWVWLDARR